MQFECKWAPLTLPMSKIEFYKTQGYKTAWIKPVFIPNHLRWERHARVQFAPQFEPRINVAEEDIQAYYDKLSNKTQPSELPHLTWPTRPSFTVHLQQCNPDRDIQPTGSIQVSRTGNVVSIYDELGRWWGNKRCQQR